MVYIGVGVTVIMATIASWFRFLTRSWTGTFHRFSNANDKTDAYFTLDTLGKHMANCLSVDDVGVKH